VGGKGKTLGKIMKRPSRPWGEKPFLWVGSLEGGPTVANNEPSPPSRLRKEKRKGVHSALKKGQKGRVSKGKRGRKARKGNKILKKKKFEKASLKKKSPKKGKSLAEEGSRKADRNYRKQFGQKEVTEGRNNRRKDPALLCLNTNRRTHCKGEGGKKKTKPDATGRQQAKRKSSPAREKERLNRSLGKRWRKKQKKEIGKEKGISRKHAMKNKKNAGWRKKKVHKKGGTRETPGSWVAAKKEAKA